MALPPPQTERQALVALANLFTGLFFGVLHAKGLIGWDVLVNFKFSSWVVQSVNIFLWDMLFAISNTMLIRGVGSSFPILRQCLKIDARVLEIEICERQVDQFTHVTRFASYLKNLVKKCFGLLIPACQ